ncbi:MULTISPECIES: hypothetical protein [unclassified Methylophaga]|uniref:hypothetical protein n=1 Tax=unclassified Methylophaga TaxID=2629249 RepID=UPI000C0E80CA|nr:MULTISPECIES: hypothetical protein [unclassified Methylophaga]MBL1457315.1 hypothetical protein [Methylophaga sp.]
MAKNRIPSWLKWSFTLMVCIIVPVYWRDLGMTNFLWFSDIALIVMVPALWLENRLLSSMMAVSVLFLELMWVLDFVSGGHFINIAGYMFAEESQWHIQILSAAFHLALPPVLILTLMRLGYDQRALPLQILLAMVVLPVTYLVSGPSDNINWVYGPAQPQTWLPPLVYLALLFVAFVTVVYLPSHWLFKRWF